MKGMCLFLKLIINLWCFHSGNGNKLLLTKFLIQFLLLLYTFPILKLTCIIYASFCHIGRFFQEVPKVGFIFDKGSSGFNQCNSVRVLLVYRILAASIMYFLCSEQ